VSQITGEFYEEMARQDEEKALLERELKVDPVNCFYCGTFMTKPNPRNPRRSEKTRDHVEPKSIGGVQIVYACRGCNGEKGALSFDEYRLVTAYRRGQLDMSTVTYKFWGEIG
jgi:hypothetical protein